MDDAEFKDPLEAEVGDEPAHEDDLDLELEEKKKKELIDPEETESLADLEEEELDEEEEPFDDVNDM